MALEVNDMSVMADVEQMRNQILSIASQNNVRNIKVFGSVARGDDAPNSDIDFLVYCTEECSLFDLIAVREDLELMLKRKIDIVTPDSIHWTLRNKILREAKDI